VSGNIPDIGSRYVENSMCQMLNMTRIASSTVSEKETQSPNLFRDFKRLKIRISFGDIISSSNIPIRIEVENDDVGISAVVVP
jgi:hypothetical protein